MTKPTPKKRNALVGVLAVLLAGAGGFKAGDWYASLNAPLTPEGAYRLLSSISNASDSAIINRYEEMQARLAEEAAELKKSLEQARARRIESEKDAQAAKAQLELAQANETIETLRRQTETAERDLMVVLTQPAQTEQAAEIQARAAETVHLLNQENAWLRGVVQKQAQVIRKQELVIAEFKSEIAQYERNLVLVERAVRESRAAYRPLRQSQDQDCRRDRGRRSRRVRGDEGLLRSERGKRNPQTQPGPEDRQDRAGLQPG